MSAAPKLPLIPCEVEDLLQEIEKLGLTTDDCFKDKSAPPCLKLHRNQAVEETVEGYLNVKTSHMLNSLGPNFVKQLKLVKRIFSEREDFFQDPLEHFKKSLAPEGEAFFVKIEDSKKKSTLLQELSAHFQSTPRFVRVEKDILLMADELITNVLYNAPPELTLSQKRPRRGDHVQLKESNCYLFAFASETHIYLGAYDTFGKLSIQATFERIWQTFQEGLGESIREGKEGGAGIGLRLMFDRAEDIFMLSKRERMTFMAYGVPLRPNRKLLHLPKNIHLVEDED